MLLGIYYYDKPKDNQIESEDLNGEPSKEQENLQQSCAVWDAQKGWLGSA